MDIPIKLAIKNNTQDIHGFFRCYHYVVNFYFDKGFVISVEQADFSFRFIDH